MQILTLPDLPPMLRFDSVDAFAPRLDGRSSRYEKRVRELAGVYQDTEAFAAAAAGNESIAYWVDESKAGTQPGALTIGMSALNPGCIGDEYFMTRGHLHEISNCAEFYYCVAGHGLLLMDDLHGRTSVAELVPGTGVHVPGGWIHRSVNVGTSTFVTLFAYDSDAGQDYEIIARAGGMRELIVRDGSGWTRRSNPLHVGYTPKGHDA